MPLQATSGAASYDGFGGGVAAVPQYIEDVFSTYLYTGNGSTQTITNGIDLSTKGGLVWTKRRVNTGGIGNTYHILTDTVRGANKQLYSNGADAQATNSNMITSFSATGYSIGSDGNVNFSNAIPQTYVSWTFRKQPKFFDVVTYTGNATARTIAHNLGSVPGCIIVKRTDSTGGWYTYHRSTGADKELLLNSTASAQTDLADWNNTSPTSTVFSVGTPTGTNINGATYVAYLFAHNAGGFGLTGTDNVISCGSFSAPSSSTLNVNLGYEPQWLLVKTTSTADTWLLYDTMRGLYGGDNGNGIALFPNTDSAEGGYGDFISLTSTGFTVKTGVYSAGTSLIYIAIRRGPMKVPTSGTSVFAPVAQAGGGTVTTNFPVDLSINRNRGATGANWMDRLRGGSTTTYNYLLSTSTAAEVTGSGAGLGFDNNTGYVDNGWWSSGQSVIYENFRRAPSFFDEVCYTGNSTANTQISHNLGVTPELMIVKNRTSTGYNWLVYSASLGATKFLFLNGVDAPQTSSSAWSNTAPTSSVFTVGTSGGTNTSPDKYVAYLFATCAGVSKVGSYTGNGSSQTINCGFTGGARFVLIKRTDSTGDWYVWDTARGIVSGNDPYLSLNTTAAEITTDDTIDPDSTGFIVNQVTATNVNVSSATYIYLAIA